MKTRRCEENGETSAVVVDAAVVVDDVVAAAAAPGTTAAAAAKRSACDDVPGKSAVSDDVDGNVDDDGKSNDDDDGKSNDDDDEKRTYAARLVACFDENLRKLGVTATAATSEDDDDDLEEEEEQERLMMKMEDMSLLIYESMSASSRNYHSVQHVFDISRDMTDPVPILAALFHDCVYYHVDGGFTERQLRIIRGSVVIDVVVAPPSDDDAKNSNNSDGVAGANNNNAEGCCYCLTVSKPRDDDVLLQIVNGVFGFVPGQRIAPCSGANEYVRKRGWSCCIASVFVFFRRRFSRSLRPPGPLANFFFRFFCFARCCCFSQLSAVIAVRELEPLQLPLKVLAQIACCIEATIPFRPREDPTTTGGGKSAADRLYDRLAKTNADFRDVLGMSDDELVLAVQRAVVLCNADLGNFGTDDVSDFLDHSWKLLPETNSSLRRPYLYTVSEYYTAVFKMHGFFQFISSDVVFSQFRGVPDVESYGALARRAGRNIEVGRRYTAAKLLSVGVLAAFAELTGGDAPMSLFLGDLPSSSRDRVERRIEAELPRFEPDDELAGRCDVDAYLLLLRGRKLDTAFDVKESPLAAYLYGYLGDDGLDEIMKDVQTQPMTDETARTLLRKLPRTSIEVVAESISKIARSRSENIQRIVDDLPEKEEDDGTSGNNARTRAKNQRGGEKSVLVQEVQ